MTLERQWLKTVLKSLKASADAGAPEQVAECVGGLTLIGVLPRGAEVETVAHVLAEAERVLGRKPTAQDFAGNGLRLLAEKADH